MKCPQTFIAGLSTILLAVFGAVQSLTDGNQNTNPDWTAITAAITAGLGLMRSRQTNVTSEQVGAKPPAPSWSATPPISTDSQGGSGKTILPAIAAICGASLLVGCVNLDVTDGHGGQVHAFALGWPWSDTSQTFDRLNLSARTNGNFTVSIRDVGQSQAISTNAAELFSRIAEGISAGAVKGAMSKP